MAWIELHQSLREHKKMFACAEVLNISKIQMVGTLVCLWLWALDNAQDGSLAGVSDKTIARVCEFPEKKASKLVQALVETGWLDKKGDALEIHDWYDYAGKLMERRAKDRERKQTTKGSRKNSDGIPLDGTRNSYATVPLPYPNHTVPKNNDDDVDESAGAREATEIHEMIGVKPGEYLYVTKNTAIAVQNVAAHIIPFYWRRPFSVMDCKKVFIWAFSLENREYRLHADAYGLLEYAFEQSLLGQGRDNWPYVEGVLNRLAARDIKTKSDAYDFDAERPDKEENL